MNDLHWDGKMDYGWEDLSELIKSTCCRFANTMSETTAFSPNVESREMISDKCMKRFESITYILADIVKHGEYYAYEDLTDGVQNASKLNGWILLGSLTETTLQMFLAFYLDDYKKTKWQQWEDFEVAKVQTPIIDCINGMVAENILAADQAKSLKTAVKEKIKEHTKEHQVQKVMLDELIQLYQHLGLLDDDEIFYLKSIQSSRNGIHSFQDRDIGNWEDLRYSARFFCYLLEWVIDHLPDIPDECY